MPKFRTMLINTPIIATGLLQSPEGHASIGKFLRSTSIDEIPQLYSVLCGDMSLVGPRPVLPSETELLAKRLESGVQNLRPGITGLAQIQKQFNLDETVGDVFAIADILELACSTAPPPPIASRK